MIEMNQLQSGIVEAASKVRANNPMAGSITNSVTIDFVANAQLAVGGSAAMVYLPDEGECLVAAGGAVYINMGTLLPVYEETLPRTAAAAHARAKPWCSTRSASASAACAPSCCADSSPTSPQSCAATPPRSSRLQAFGTWKATRASFPAAAASTPTDTVAAARDAAVALARYTGGAVAVSGESDLVTDGSTVAYSTGGSALMGKVTGFGCSLGGVAAVYATQADPFTAALAAVAHYNVAGTRAAAAAGRARKLQGRLRRRALPRDARRHREQPAARRGGLA